VCFGLGVGIDVYIRRDSAGSIAITPGASDVVLYFLSNKHASLSTVIELECSEEFDGDISVSSWILFTGKMT